MGLLDNIFGNKKTTAKQNRHELVAVEMEVSAEMGFPGQPPSKPSSTIIAEVTNLYEGTISLKIYNRTNNNEILHDIPSMRKLEDDDTYMAHVFEYTLRKTNTGYVFHYMGHSAPAHIITFEWQ